MTRFIKTLAISSLLCFTLGCASGGKKCGGQCDMKDKQACKKQCDMKKKGCCKSMKTNKS